MPATTVKPCQHPSPECLILKMHHRVMKKRDERNFFFKPIPTMGHSTNPHSENRILQDRMKHCQQSFSFLNHGFNVSSSTRFHFRKLSPYRCSRRQHTVEHVTSKRAAHDQIQWQSNGIQQEESNTKESTVRYTIQSCGQGESAKQWPTVCLGMLALDNACS